MEINLAARDIRAFMALARTLSFSKTARQMHLSQSALSTLIVRMEEAFGTRLFDRTTRSVNLTAAGTALLAHAEHLLLELDRTVTAVREVATLRRGRVAVAALPSLAARLIPRLFRAFAERHPDIGLSLIDTLSAPAFELVREGKVDFALTAANPVYGDLDYVPLTTDSFMLLAPQDHPLASKARGADFLQTLRYPHISMSHPTSVRQYADAAALQHGIRFSPQYEVDHLATIGAMVQANLGIAALPAMAVDVIRLDGIVRVPLRNPVIRRSIGLVRRKEKPLSAAAQTMVDMLQAQIRKTDRRRPVTEGAKN